MTTYHDPATAADVRAGIAADIIAVANRYLADVGPDEYSPKVRRAFMRAAEIADGRLNPDELRGDDLARLCPPTHRARERASFAALLDAEGDEQS